MHESEVLRQREAAVRDAANTGRGARPMDEGKSESSYRNFGAPTLNGPVRRGIRERIDETIASSEGHLRRAHAAHRARHIIDQHPEFAELLDLLTEF